MASRLSLIAASDQFSDYQEVIGADLLDALNVLQGRYEVATTVPASDSFGTLQRPIVLDPPRFSPCSTKTSPTQSSPCFAALRPTVNVRTGQ
jgi:hypothetical protein